MDQTRVLYVGEAEWPEFREVHHWLAEHAALRDAPDLSAALALLEKGICNPTLVVLAQRWPGEFSAARIDRLRRAAPLARFSEVLGAWCEGEARSGEPLPGTLPLYWHQWVARLAPEFALESTGAAPVWRLPPTATDEERLIAVVDRPRRREQGLLTIHTRNAETAAALCEAAASRGFAATWVRSRRLSHLSGIRAAIWEATRGAQEEARDLAAWRAALGGAPLLAVVDFPRLEDRALFAAAGAAAIVSKPFWLDDIFWQIEQIAPDKAVTINSIARATEVH